MAAVDSRIRAVRKVLYEPRRLKKLATHLSSIAVLMNLDARNPLPPNDARVDAGSGPNWFVPATGKINPAVQQAADRCEAVASLLLETRNELAKVAFPATDKRHLLTALREEAAAWGARAALWRAPGRPGDGATRAIASHLQASAREYAHVRRYLKSVDLRNVR